MSVLRKPELVYSMTTTVCLLRSSSLIHSAPYSICSLSLFSLAGDTRNGNYQFSGYNEVVNEGAKVALEIDLRSRNPSKRTAHWFVNGTQQPVSFCNLPSTVQFGITLSRPGDSVALISFNQLQKATTVANPDGSIQKFYGDVPRTVL